MGKATDTSRNGSVSRARLRAIDKRCTAVIRIGSALFYVTPDKATPEHERYLIEELERSRNYDPGDLSDRSPESTRSPSTIRCI